MRVYELAKKIGINSKQLICQLQQRGLEVKNHMSVVPEETVKHFLEVANAIQREKPEARPVSKSKDKRQKADTSKDNTLKKRAGDKAPPFSKSTEEKKQPLEPVEIIEGITLKELAQKMGIKSNEIIKHLMSKGKMVTINQVLEGGIASEIVKDFDLVPKIISLEISKDSFKALTKEEGKALTHRPPVVTIMGHVDHGKTLLLDAIRSTDIVNQEAGGITQHIGAYKVKLPSGEITFLDTPGHEAFTAMRARGAQVTDLVVLVVAADDGVMPQTVEAINHAREAGVPILVAVNKIDKAEASPDRVRQELVKYELVPEEWGGQTIFLNVSAKQKTGLEELLEMIILESEMLELKANPDKPALGTIVEAKLDKGRGPVATVLVQDGTLKMGDPFVCGLYFGKVRALINDKGEKVDETPPSTPVEVLGFGGVPQAGDSFAVVTDERKGHQIAQMRQEKARELSLQKKGSRVSLADLHKQISQGEIQELKVIIKADVQGSVEAISDALGKENTDKVQIKTIHGAVGAITEMDVMLASASNAIVVGFNVRPQPKAARLAGAEGVDIRLYTIIYDLIADIKAALQGMLAPQYQEVTLGRAEVKETFHISKIGTIAGTLVQEGKMVRNAKARLLRDNVVVHEGTIDSLKRFKDDAKEVANGYECGIKLAGYNDIKRGDIIEAYALEEVPTTV